MHRAKLTIPAPPNFDFWRTAYSHGWCDLLPFSYSNKTEELTRILSLDNETIVHARMTGTRRRIEVRIESDRPLAPEQKHAARKQIQTCLRLDEEYRHFHSAARRHAAHKWIATTGSGRLLRSPTVFEDVVKMICTTNCTWALTKLMVTNLVNNFGKPFRTAYAFPTPDVIATSTEAYLRKEIKLGYRSPFILELAQRVASGKLNLESWRTSDEPTEDLFTKMLEVKGIGPYAAGNIMKLIGRYDYLGLDSWVRAQYYKLHHKGRRVKDSTIEKHYEQYGTWRGLIFWLEMTRYWHDEKFTL